MPIAASIAGQPDTALAMNIPTKIKGAAIARQTRKTTRQGLRRPCDAGRSVCRKFVTRIIARLSLEISCLVEKAIRRELSMPALLRGVGRTQGAGASNVEKVARNDSLAIAPSSPIRVGRPPHPNSAESV